MHFIYYYLRSSFVNIETKKYYIQILCIFLFSRISETRGPEKSPQTTMGIYGGFILYPPLRMKLQGARDRATRK